MKLISFYLIYCYLIYKHSHFHIPYHLSTTKNLIGLETYYQAPQPTNSCSIWSTNVHTHNINEIHYKKTSSIILLKVTKKSYEICSKISYFYLPRLIMKISLNKNLEKHFVTDENCSYDKSIFNKIGKWWHRKKLYSNYEYSISYFKTESSIGIHCRKLFFLQHILWCQNGGNWQGKEGCEINHKLPYS